MEVFRKKIVRGSIKHVESDTQRACIMWFRLQYRWPEYVIFSIPNGIRTSSFHQAAIAKAEGLLKGVPDLCVPLPRGNYHGLYIEMKSLTGRVDPDQRVMLDKLESEGYKTAVCRTLEEFQNVVQGYMALGRKVS